MCVKALLDAGSDPSAKNMASKARAQNIFGAILGSIYCVQFRAILALTVSPLSSPAQTALDLAEEGRHMGALRMMRLVLERREANGSNGAAHRRAK